MVNIKNRSFSITAEIVAPDDPPEGVIIAGGRFGGWSVYTKDGKATFVYNLLGINEFATTADRPIPAGTHQVRMEFAYDGGGIAKGGNVTLYYDGNRSGRAGSRHPTDDLLADETTDIGYNPAPPSPATTPHTPAGSPARSTGFNSTSAATTTTTTSTPKNDYESPYPGAIATARARAGRGIIELNASLTSHRWQPASFLDRPAVGVGSGFASPRSPHSTTSPSSTRTAGLPVEPRRVGKSPSTRAGCQQPPRRLIDTGHERQGFTQPTAPLT